MIGVVADTENRAVVEEFFELFKTPWQYFSPGSSCNILITTDGNVPETDAKVIIVYGIGESGFDKKEQIKRAAKSGVSTLRYGTGELPVYNGLLLFSDQSSTVVKTAAGECVAFALNGPDKKILRVGYDLFEEVSFLLRGQQPIEQALNPSIEIHIALLRNFILSSGLKLLEVPPVPVGHSFFTTLTHDVDFIRILDHKLDKTVLGFIFRALFMSTLQAFKSKSLFKKFLRNIKALLSLPGVYLGLKPDIWLQLNRYMELDKGLFSTFYFIPFKGRIGSTDPDHKRPPASRISKYDINDYSGIIKQLVEEGFEVGLHGIDAWHDTAEARKELEVITGLAGKESNGIRMHWLYFSEKSPAALKESGVFYDSSLGYNETVGYRSGTMQVYQFPDSGGLFEVPMLVMDCAMLFPSTMALSEENAFGLCKKMIETQKKYGGVFNVNWHQRSIAPERCWDGFYIKLIKELKSADTCFVTVKQAVRWFEMRRDLKFIKVDAPGEGIKIELKGERCANLPGLRIRLHNNSEQNKRTGNSYIDTDWCGESEKIYEQ